MNKLITALEKELLTPEPTLLGKIKNIFTAAVFYLIWGSLVLLVYKHFIFTPNVQFSPFYQPSVVYTFLAACVFAPIFEEAIFRYPLSILKTAKAENYILYYVVLSSIVFGYAHYGVWSIPVQGVAGLLMCYVYLKNGYSLISSMSTHFLINFYWFITK